MMETSNAIGRQPGFFVTFEGGEGSGKTTQISRLAAHLRSQGEAVCQTREPGGTPAADVLRDIILSGKVKELGVETEALLFAAARRDHIEGVILPALSRQEVVLCDRFHDSTRVYQGSKAGLEASTLSVIEAATLDGVLPDLTVILDIPAVKGLERAALRRGQEKADRFESEGIELHEQRRAAFLAIAAREPHRCMVVDAARDMNSIEAEIRAIVLERLACKRRDSTTGGRV